MDNRQTISTFLGIAFSRPGGRSRPDEEIRGMRALRLLLAVLACLAAPPRLLGGVVWTITELGSFGGSHTSAFGLTHRNQVVGSSQFFTGFANPFLWDDGELINLGVHGGPGGPNGPGGSAQDINNASRIVGYAGGPNGLRAFLYENGVMLDLGVLPGGSTSQAYAINEAGQVAGHSRNAGGQSRAVVFEGGAVINLGTLGGSDSGATDINDAGQVVGRARLSNEENRAFLFEGGLMTSLGTLGGDASVAEGLNDLGQVVGHSRNANGQERAFLYENGSMFNLGTLGGNRSQALDISNLGIIVGWSLVSDGSPHAFMYDGGVMTDLNTLFPEGSGWTELRVAFAINDLGQIVGEGIYKGETRGFLLTPPAPELIRADLDIKPGSCPNSFNRNSRGVLPVALVGTESFDVLDVDLSTVFLSRADGLGGSVAANEGPPGPHSVFADVATPFDGEPCDCHELEGDGITDLSMKFRTDDVVSGLELDGLPPGALVELVLTGMTLDGMEFEARDCIRLVPPGKPSGLLPATKSPPGSGR